MTWTLEQLPNPHLAEFLPAEFEFTPQLDDILKEFKCAQSWQFKDLDFQDQMEVMPLRQAHLAACRLPHDYDELLAADQRKARFRTLRSWYNPKEPNVLVQNVEKLINATYLWVEEYIKPAERNQGTYFYRDPAHKYPMIRAAFGPALVESEPSKTLITAPRGSTKTRTLIGQVVPMMVCCRPYTQVLVSEINEDRTLEETTHILREFEENEIIRADFGGKGTLFPANTRGAVKWTPSWMDMIHHSGSSIRGRSWNSKQRGRHPTLWIIDDPEDPSRPMSAEERRVFWTLLFRRGLPMLTRGNVFLWISTLILGGCCHQAMQGSLDQDKELKDELADIRFDDWKMHNFDLLNFKEDGTVESLYPDHLSVAGYQAKEQSHGKREAMAEYRGIATAAGEFVFPREKFSHSYMHCFREENNKRYEYMYDLVTGEQMEWDRFLETLYTATATDIANSRSRDADYGAVVVCGVDGKKFPTFYVLDAFIKQTISDELVWRAYDLSAIWRCEKAGWEVGSMQNVVVRYAKQYNKRMEEEGRPSPKLVEISNRVQQKVPRIIATLRVLYAHKRIRFPVFGTITDRDGVVHTSVEHPGKLYLKLLMSQLDFFTDEGASGHDDGPDALHMVVQLLRNSRGCEPVEEDQNLDQIQKWAEQGVEFSAHAIPLEAWTPEMWEAHKTCEPELYEMDGIYD